MVLRYGPASDTVGVGCKGLHEVQGHASLKLQSLTVLSSSGSILLILTICLEPVTKV